MLRHAVIISGMFVLLLVVTVAIYPVAGQVQTGSGPETFQCETPFLGKDNTEQHTTESIGLYDPLFVEENSDSPDVNATQRHLLLFMLSLCNKTTQKPYGGAGVCASSPLTLTASYFLGAWDSDGRCLATFDTYISHSTVQSAAGIEPTRRGIRFTFENSLHSGSRAVLDYYCQDGDYRVFEVNNKSSSMTEPQQLDVEIHGRAICGMVGGIPTTDTPSPEASPIVVVVPAKKDKNNTRLAVAIAIPCVIVVTLVVLGIIFRDKIRAAVRGHGSEHHDPQHQPDVEMQPAVGKGAPRPAPHNTA